MVSLNPNFKILTGNYLFSEISYKVNNFVKKYPNLELFKLGIGNTTEPLTGSVIQALHEAIERLAHIKTYTGYGDEQGNKKLREEIKSHYKKKGIQIEAEEIFISDGAKPDVANIQSLFSKNAVIAIQDPVYPVYVDSNILAGRKNFVYLPATKENGFFPNIPSKKVDLIYLCSPNNPTGAVATKEQLQAFIDYARSKRAIIIFDAAYDMFIQDNGLPKSIYEIEGSKECCIEINSFSKSAGFTGVRLGWTVVPKSLVCEYTQENELNRMWFRRQATMFNGASNIAQAGGLAVLSAKGQEECKNLTNYYMKNAHYIVQHLKGFGLTIFGGINAPYIWVKTPENTTSWEFFDLLLEKAHVVVTPGVGFGQQGEGYIRISAFGHKENIKKAVEGIGKNIHL